MTRRSVGSLPFLLVVLISAGCGAPVEGDTPTVILRDCPLEGLDEPVRCGTLEVFENRASRAGRRIGVRVAVVPARDSQASPDPVFIIVGGPGQSAIDNAARYVSLLSAVRQSRDLVFVDQRGTGRSNALPCDLYSTQPAGTLGDFMPLDAVRACKDSLAGHADVRFYTSELAADDLEDVRKGLGYEYINIESASYGTRVALVYLRRYGTHARTAVLRSVSPPWVRQPLHFAEDAQAAWDSLVASCGADAACRSAFPRLSAEFDSLLVRLERAPVTVAVPASDSGAAPRSIALGTGPFAEKVRLMLYAPELSAFLPLLIHRAYGGDFGPFAEFADEIGQQISRIASNGMYLSVTCPEDVARITDREAGNRWPGTFLRDFRVQQQRAACALWPKGDVPPDFADRVRSQVPVLLISSAIDPITPPRWASEAAENLTKSRHVILPYAGHSPASECVMAIVSRFIAAASTDNLDLTCIREGRRPAFALTLP